MVKPTEKAIFSKIALSLNAINKAIQTFNNFLQASVSFSSQDYYLARNLLRDGDAFYQEALKDAKKLLGPLPDYVPPDFVKSRQDLLEKANVLAKGQTLEDLRAELEKDEFLMSMMSSKEVETYLKQHYFKQQTGKRKLSNIKVRILLSKLEALLSKAQDLKEKAQKKHQQQG
jgi:hypothetical protein